MRLRFVTYNVHRCIGLDRTCNPDRIARVLVDLDADVIALQEVDTSTMVEPEHGWLQDVAAATGHEIVFGPTVPLEAGGYGNALLVRHELRSVRRHDLSVFQHEPRGALEVMLAMNGRRVRVVATHLGLRRSERRSQITRLLSILGESRDSHITTLLGDFNLWFPRASNSRRLEELFGPAPRMRTYPSPLPVFELDRIWVMPREAVVDSGVAKGWSARVASDHLPGYCDVRI